MDEILKMLDKRIAEWDKAIVECGDAGNLQGKMLAEGKLNEAKEIRAEVIKIRGAG